MNHREMQDRLNDYADGLLPEPERKEVAQHLQQCEPCRREVASLRALLASADALPRSVLPERDLWPEIEAQTALPQAAGSPGAGTSPERTSPPAEDLAPIVRGLAGEVRELRQAVEDLRWAIESSLPRAVRDTGQIGGGLRVLRSNP
jgi:hypothetical protein